MEGIHVNQVLDVASMEIKEDRRKEIRAIADFVLANKIENLLFVCTHNSRRSQFCQIAFAAAAQGLGYGSYSAGTEVTAVYPSVINTLKEIGFEVKSAIESFNPKYSIFQEDDTHLIDLWSKTFNDDSIPTEKTLAIMTCSDAEQNCPFIPNAAGRIPLRYEDPKFSDGTSDEAQVYTEKFNEIYLEVKLLVDFIA